MGYRSLQACINDLEENGFLIRIKEEVDPYLEMSAIQLRVFQEEGKAVLFENVKGSKFPAVSNLFGTLEQSRFIFRDTLQDVKNLVALKADPLQALKKPWEHLSSVMAARMALPKKVSSHDFQEIQITDIPQLHCWPMDGGSFITLPQVYSEDIDKPGVMNSNLGMYRVQLSGNEYEINKEIGLHYQIHRGIGVHQSKAVAQKKSLKVSVFVGGPPAHTLAAVMPLPEGMSELTFAGLLGGRRFRYTIEDGYTLSTDADFVICGEINADNVKPEGPFGDHTGYYNEQEYFPVVTIEKMTFRDSPIYHSTYTGRPPDEPAILGVALNEVFVPLLKKQFPEISDFYLPPEGCSYRMAVVTMRKEYPGHAKRVMFGVWSFLRQFMYTKFIIVTDDDVNARSWEDVIWAMTTRMDPARDCTIVENTPIDYLDFASPVAGLGSKMGMDATHKWEGETDREWGRTIEMDTATRERVDALWESLGITLPGR